MGRHQKLTDMVWAEIGRRYANREPGRKLADEFKVSEAAIRKRFGSQRAQIISAATILASTEQVIETMPRSAQMSVRALADQLKSITTNVARAAQAGSETAALLNEHALKRAKDVMRKEAKDGHLVDSGVRDDLTDLQIMANRALGPSVRLLIAGQGKDDPGEDKPQSLEELYDRLLG